MNASIIVDADEDDNNVIIIIVESDETRDSLFPYAHAIRIPVECTFCPVSACICMGLCACDLFVL